MDTNPPNTALSSPANYREVVPMVADTTSSRQTTTQELSSDVLKLWTELCSVLSEEQIARFSSLTCENLDAYITSLSADCSRLKDASISAKITKWLKPLYLLADPVVSIASAAASATGHAIPTGLIMGGIRGVLQLTMAIPDLQARAIRLLDRMGSRASILETYNWLLYRDELFAQKALLTVYKDILVFVQEVDSYFFRNRDNFFRKSKHKLEAIFLDKFSDALDKSTATFENDIETFGHAVASLQLQKTDNIQEISKELLALGKAAVQLLTEERLQRRKAEETRKFLEEQRRDRDVYDACMDWLSDVDFRLEYRMRCDQQLEGTGQWLLSSDRYTGWKNSRQSEMLWLRGNPGSGKSVLSSIVITDLLNDPSPDVGVAYALFQRKNRAEQSILAVLSAMTGQLLLQRNRLNASVKAAWSTKQGKRSIEDRTAFEFLNDTASMFEKVYLIVDAPEESRDPRAMLRGLIDQILKDSTSHRVVNIMVLSRHLYEVDTVLDPYPHITTDVENREDIKAYIESKLEGEEYTEAREICRIKANGMFMWVNLALSEKNIRFASGTKSTKSAGIVNHLDDLPPELNGLYDLIFEDISSQGHHHQRQAWLILFWILKANEFRPLSVKEMLEAIGDYEGVGKVGDIKTLADASIAIELCKNLIYIDIKDNFSFIHDSVRSYLEQAEPRLSFLREFQVQAGGIHTKLASLCLSYLGLDDFNEDIQENWPAHDNFLAKHPFADYAGRYWGEHAAKGDIDQLLPAILQYVRSTPRRELTIQLTVSSRPLHADLWRFVDTTNELHCLCLFDLPQVAQILVEQSGLDLGLDGSNHTPQDYAFSIDRYEGMSFWLLDYACAQDGRLLSPEDLQQALSCAAQRGWLKILQRLAEIDADLMNCHLGDPGFTALMTACIAGNEASVRELIRLGADANVKSTDGSTALNAVAIRGKTDLVDFLLRNGAFPNDPDSEGWTALHHCAGNDDEMGMQYLLKRDGDPCIKTVGDGRTCAHEAALENSSKALKKLKRLRPSLNWNVENNKGYTPLHVAAWENNHEIARLLIGYKCNIDKPDKMKRTALHIAIKVGGEETAKLLIDSGSSLMLCDSNGETPLHYAAEYSRISILRRMVTKLESYGQLSCLHIQNTFKSTALHLACMAGCEESTRILLDARADFRIKGASGASCLHYAVCSGNEKLAKLILGYSKDSQVLDNNQETILHYAARYNKPDFMIEYLKACTKYRLPVDFAAVNTSKQTALFCAVLKENSAVVDILLQKTPAITYDIVNSNKHLLMHIAAFNGDTTLFQTVIGTNSPLTRGWRDRSPLMYAIAGGKLDMVKYLMTSHSFDLNGKEQEGATPLLLAIGIRRFDIARYLLQYEQDVNVLDNHQRSALHLAAQVNDDDFFRLLLQRGCRAYNADNIKGQTPLHLAALRLSPVMVNSLLEFGFHEVRALDKHDRNVSFGAAEQGNIELLRRIKELGVPLDGTDSSGFNLAHYAASSGHLNVLKYLAKEGVNIFARAYNDTTPFWIAADKGYPNIVKYYIEQRSLVVKDISLPSRATALIRAVWQCHIETAAILWQQDDIVNATDAFGYTAHDLSHPTLDHISQDYTIPYETRHNMQENLIRICLESLSTCRSLENPKDVSYFMDNASVLERALRFYGDFDSAKSLIMPALFAEQYRAHYYPPPACAACMTEENKDVMFVCKSCYDRQILCESCYGSYEDAEKDIPEALADLATLEKEVRRIRIICDNYSNIWEATTALSVFEGGQRFIATNLAKYDRWEQIYQPDTNYRWLDRPGHTWVRLFQECFDLMEDKTNNEIELSKQLSDLQRRYQELLIKFKARRDIREFRCKGHDYQEMKREDFETLQTAGILYDPITGRPTQAMFRHIATIYRVSDTSNRHTIHQGSDYVVSRAVSTQPDQPIANQHVTGASALPTALLLRTPEYIQEIQDAQQRQSHTTETGKQKYHDPNVSIRESRILNELSANQNIVREAALDASTVESPRTVVRAMSFDSLGSIARLTNNELVRPPQRAFTDTMLRRTREYRQVEIVPEVPSGHEHQTTHGVQTLSIDTSAGNVQQAEQLNRGSLNTNDTNSNAGSQPVESLRSTSAIIRDGFAQFRTALEADASGRSWTIPDNLRALLSPAASDFIPLTIIDREAIIDRHINAALSADWIVTDDSTKFPDRDLSINALPGTQLKKFEQMLVDVLLDTVSPQAFANVLRLYEAMYPGFIYEYIHQQSIAMEAARAAESAP